MPIVTSIPRELTHIEKLQRTLYRPTKFRKYLFVDNRAPGYVHTIHERQLVSTASVALTGSVAGQVPMAEVSQTSTSRPVLKYGAGYRFSDDEILEARATGIPLDSERSLANGIAAEQKLDEIAAIGDATVGITGIGNNADIPTVTAVTKAAGGTTWAVATAKEIVTDLWALALGINVNSLENYIAGAIILPQAQWNTAVTTCNENTDKNAMQIFREQSNGRITLDVWNRFSTLGAGATPRALGLGIPSTGESTAEGAPAKMDIPREWIESGTRLQIADGWEVRNNFKTAGVKVRNPQAFAYMDAL